MDTIGLYVKAIASLVVTGLTSFIAADTDGSVNTVEIITIVIAVLTAGGVVWAIPSTPEWLQKWAKAVAAALVAGLAALVIGITDGGGDTLANLNRAEVITAIVAFLTSFGLVGVASNAASSDPTNARGQIVPVSYETKANLVNTPGV